MTIQPIANAWHKWFVHHKPSNTFPQAKLILAFVFTLPLSKLARWFV